MELNISTITEQLKTLLESHDSETLAHQNGWARGFSQMNEADRRHALDLFGQYQAIAQHMSVQQLSYASDEIFNLMRNQWDNERFQWMYGVEHHPYVSKLFAERRAYLEELQSRLCASYAQLDSIEYKRAIGIAE
jgi:hypothetical protein